MKKCVFAGTFDPPTVGHAEVVDKCLKIFDEVVVAVMVNHEKTPLLSVEQREKLLNKLYSDEPRVKVRTFYGLAVDLLKEENTPFYVRGVRNTVDFEYENQDRFASEKLYGDMVTVYIPAKQDSLHISSSAVKTCIKFKADFDEYLPPRIRADVLRLLK